MFSSQFITAVIFVSLHHFDIASVCDKLTVVLCSLKCKNTNLYVIFNLSVMAFVIM